MPTKREREYYRMGFKDGVASASETALRRPRGGGLPYEIYEQEKSLRTLREYPKRKLSAWNKYVKANSKKPRFRYRNGKLNLKKMAIAFRKTPAGRKKRR
jgi:hypothetical protein